MLPDRKWETEPLLRFIAGVCFVFAIGSLAAIAFLPKAAAATAEGKFFMLVTNAVILHGGALLLVAMLLRAHATGWREAFGWRLGSFPRAAMFGVIGVLVALPLTLLLQQMAQRGLNSLQEQLVAHEIKSIDVKPEAQQLVQTIQETESLGQQVFYALLAILFAPLVEEILFRGILYPAIKLRGHPHLALWGTSIAFALMHRNMTTILPLAFLALLLVFLYERTGNLLAPILTHSLFNAANYVALVYGGEVKQFFHLSP